MRIPTYEQSCIESNKSVGLTSEINMTHFLIDKKVFLIAKIQ